MIYSEQQARDDAVEKLIRVIEVVGSAAIHFAMVEMNVKSTSPKITVERDGPMRLLVEDAVDALLNAANPNHGRFDRSR